MLAEILSEIMTQYPAARRATFAGHPLAQTIRADLPAAFRSQLPGYPDYIFRASAGQGQWAEAPWFAIFDPAVTETAQRGYYPAYLFSRSLDRVYLSLMQGMTDLRELVGVDETKAILRGRADQLRRRLGDQLPARFKFKSIDLQASGPSSRLAMYEAGHMFGVTYSRRAMPTDADILADLGKMLELYSLVKRRGGTEGSAGVGPMR